VARQTRSSRRDRDRENAAQNGAERARSRAVVSAPGQPAQPARKRGVGGVITFIGESWAELKKVDWPGQSQVIQGTVVVLIACVIVGVFLYANDLVWKRFVQNVLLGQ
jgi:preprotein translocase subunit SecE